MTSIDAVLPLTTRDLDRAAFLFETLDRHFEPLGRLWVVAPAAEHAAVAAAVPESAVVLDEDELVPELPRFRTAARVRARLRIVGPPFHGWYVQQLVKLAIAARVGTPYYLTLDADVICRRRTTYDELVPDGRALAQTTPPNHPEWNDDAERVLRLPRSGTQYAVTPALLAVDAVRALAIHVERISGDRWRRHLLRSLPWTEYALYHTFLEQTGLFDRFHVLADRDAIYDDCVWMEGQFADWEPSAGSAPFTVVQSATRIEPQRVAAKLRALAGVRE